MNSPPTKRPSGMLGLTIVLAGQAMSILASSMTGFALSIWVFQKTSSVTSLGIMQTAVVLLLLGSSYNVVVYTARLGAWIGTLWRSDNEHKE